MRVAAIVGSCLSLVAAGAGPAAAADCLRATPPAPTAPARHLRFGVTPQLAGSAGTAQQPARPVDRSRTLSALRRLRPPGRRLVVRLNRMFWSDGRAGIARYARLADRYAAHGFEVELQVRYHPPAGRAGDLDAWARYVRRVVRTFAARRAVVELSITNEANLPVSPNTSDGSFRGVVGALVRGIVAARREADRLGRRDLALGFTYAYRFTPASDDRFFAALGRRSTRAFRAALDHVGLQLYPGRFYPPVTADPAGDVVEALTLLRSCWMPKARLGRRTAIWITENGYATPARLGQARQARDATATIGAVARYAGTLNVTDYRWFNLRDNRSSGPGLFDAVGLLFDDYARKPAFGAMRRAIARYGR